MPLQRMINQPDSPEGRRFGFLIQFLILVSVFTFSIETLPTLSSAGVRVLNGIEIFVTVIFTLEYLLRLYYAEHKLRFVFSFYGLIDLLAIVPFYLGQTMDLRSLRVVRMARAFRVLKMVRYTRALERMRRAIVEIKEELVVYCLGTLCLIYLASIGIYYFERDAQPEAFGSVFHAMWWAMVTLSTVGYGDIYPITTGGRIFTSCILWLGIGAISVPSGLMASSLAKVDRETKAEQAKERVRDGEGILGEE